MAFINEELEKLKKNYNIDELIYIVKNIDEKIMNTGLVFEASINEVMYYNHILALSKRIVEKNLIDEMDLSCLDEISKDSLEIARESISEIFQKYDLAMNETECFLIATHIEMNKRKGGK